jgi:uroporphyrinogen-III synthase
MDRVRSTVIVTRPEGAYAGADRLRDRLAKLGFRPIVLPISKVEQLSVSAQTKEAVRRVIASTDQWIAFLSPSAVFVFKNVLKKATQTSKIPSTIPLAAQGKGTAEAIKACFEREPDFLPTRFVAEEFAAELARFMDDQSKVFVPQSADGRDVFGPALRACGFQVETVDTYCIVDAPLAEELRHKVRGLVGIEAYIIFMSPSAVRATARAFKDDRAALESLRIVSVGPVTSEAVRGCGLQVFAEAAEHSEDGVIDELMTKAS